MLLSIQNTSVPLMLAVRFVSFRLRVGSMGRKAFTVVCGAILKPLSPRVRVMDSVRELSSGVAAVASLPMA
ncbi:hypothetical protein [uncultured Bacteroides sp.]|uniref:hypothetical protein n=1 Tax=uncultured Bacteroides sp. TaxID=162156 RepID=UPI00263186DB|nr:hypothetical protein [uncultured Bacteroides sp.]